MHDPQLKLLTREIASLSANLQRESNRRAAAAAHAKVQEERATDAESRLRQVQYANRKLEERIGVLKVSSSSGIQPLRERLRDLEQAVTSRTALACSHLHQARALAGELQASAGNSSPSLQHLGRAVEAAEAVLRGTTPECLPPSIDQEKQELRAEMERLRTQLAEATKCEEDPAPGVDAAVQELQAVVPQYRATATQLQGHVTVLAAQLATVTAERDQVKSEAARWKAAAARNEANYAATAAKLHTSEAHAAAASASSQASRDQLAGEVVELRQRCASLEAAAQEAGSQAVQARQQLQTKASLLKSQQETIARLEGTISEQQADIIAALDLVCNRTPGLPFSAAGGAPLTCDGESSSVLGGSAAPGPEPSAETFADRDFRVLEQQMGCYAEHSEEGPAWSIPSNTGMMAPEDPWLRQPFEPVNYNTTATGVAPGQKGAATDVAAEIAALQEALRHVLDDI